MKTGRYTRDKQELRRQLRLFMREAAALAALVDARVSAAAADKPL